MAWTIVVSSVVGLTFVAMGVVAVAGLSSGREPGTFVYVLTVAALAAAYTVAPFVKDDHAILVAWPGVMLALAGSGLWIIADVLGPPRNVIVYFGIALLLVLSSIALVKSTFATLGQDAVSLTHPLLLKSMKGTHSTPEGPVPLTLPFVSSKFASWAPLGNFLRKERLADLVVVGRRKVTIRIGRVIGLGRFLSIMLLPFGATIIRANSRGFVVISVDPHTYNLLERPGPYDQYCRNLLGSLEDIATDVSRGRLAEAKQMAFARVPS